ncbi:hypothetical protein [Fretibacter rubidus]|uniref:porin n=1 Tax=Fretibacter rubidus TaxID=570162 RepID=UPI00352A2C56
MNTSSRPAFSTLMLATVGVMAITAIAASAQSGSPFANKKKKQAWETQAPAPAPAPAAPTQNYQAPQYQAPTYQAPNYQAPAVPTSRVAVPPRYQSSAPTVSAPTVSPPTLSGATTQTSGSSFGTPSHNAPHYSAPNYSAPNHSTQSTAPQTYGTYQPSAPKPDSGHHYPGRVKAYDQTQYRQTQYSSGQAAGQSSQGQNFGQYAPQNQNYQNQGYQNQGYQAQSQPPYSQSPMARPPKQSWKDRLGLGNLATTLSGFLKLGAAATYEDDISGDGFREDFIGDAVVRGEVSAITQGGLEYGVGAELRGQYDKYRRGFGGRIGDCPVGTPGCGTTTVAGTPTALRGHTSGFYGAGLDDAKDFEVALEGAYLFLRSSYGDITVGRDDGAAYLFSLGAPTVVAVNASNSPVDYTGLDSVKTVNDASGFAEKITYVSPRLLGDQIGVGVQFGASYAPNARACGVDYCVRSNGKDASGALRPDLEDVIELGLSLDRKFDSGLSVEATASYARASEKSGLVGFDDLQNFGAGLEFALKGWRLGGSYLNSNNGLEDGDYTAYDVGVLYKPGRLGASLSYGHAKDDNVWLTSDQATLGLVYDMNERFTIGTGVQYVERRVPGITTLSGTTSLTRNTERAASVFVEGGVTF